MRKTNKLVDSDSVLCKKRDFFFNETLNKSEINEIFLFLMESFGYEFIQDFADQLKSWAFYHSTMSGLSVSIDDMAFGSPQTPFDIGDHVSQELQKSESSISDQKETEKISTTNFGENVKEAAMVYMAKQELNALLLFSNSGARGNKSQVIQMAACRGQIVNLLGEILGFHIDKSLREGSCAVGFAHSCHGSRKGVVDGGVRTADAGHLTRCLVDVAHKMIIRTKTCLIKTTSAHRGIQLGPLIDFETGEIIQSSSERIENRVAGTKGKQASEVCFEQNNLNKKQAQILSQAHILDLTKASSTPEVNLRTSFSQIENHPIKQSVNSFYIRSPLTCGFIKGGICQTCYGYDFETGKLSEIGTAVGILAAQSIGAVGTQLTLRTFHSGGVASGGKLRLGLLYAPKTGKLQYSPKMMEPILLTNGQMGFLTRFRETLQIDRKILILPERTCIRIAPNQIVQSKQPIGEILTSTTIFETRQITKFQNCRNFQYAKHNVFSDKKLKPNRNDFFKIQSHEYTNSPFQVSRNPSRRKVTRSIQLGPLIDSETGKIIQSSSERIEQNSNKNFEKVLNIRIRSNKLSMRNSVSIRKVQCTSLLLSPKAPRFMKSIFKEVNFQCFSRSQTPGSMKMGLTSLRVEHCSPLSPPNFHEYDGVESKTSPKQTFVCQWIYSDGPGTYSWHNVALGYGLYLNAMKKWVIMGKFFTSPYISFTATKKCDGLPNPKLSKKHFYFSSGYGQSLKQYNYQNSYLSPIMKHSRIMTWQINTLQCLPKRMITKFESSPEKRLDATSSSTKTMGVSLKWAQSPTASKVRNKISDESLTSPSKFYMYKKNAKSFSGRDFLEHRLGTKETQFFVSSDQGEVLYGFLKKPTFLLDEYE